MAQLSDENEKVTSSVIPNQTEAKIMRNLIENKGLLNGKGKLYAGTDDTTSTGAPVTTAIDPSGAVDDSVLIKDSSQAGGWTVDKIGKDNIKDAAITPEKLDPTKEYTVKNITANGNVIIQAERDDVTWSGTGMQYTINSNYGGELRVPDRNMSVPETFATEEEVKRQIEGGEIVAKTAQYASEDTSKGTIEERLTSLGFKEGDFTLTDLNFYWTYAGRGEQNLGQTIKISREGNYCFLPGRVNTATGVYRSYALFKTTTGSVAANTTIGFVPAEFAPETSISFRTYIYTTGLVQGGGYWFKLCGKDTDTPGEFKTGLSTSISSGTKACYTFIDNDDIESSDSYRKGWYSKASTSSSVKKLIAPLNLSVEWRDGDRDDYFVVMTITNPNNVDVTANWSSDAAQKTGTFNVSANSTTSDTIIIAETDQDQGSLDGDVYFSAEGYSDSNSVTFN